jgi:hypothetical protein
MNKHRNAQKRAFAEKNQERRDNLSPLQQIAVLDERLGKGIGAVKERARLERLLTQMKNKNQKRDNSKSHSNSA